jgi:hypothetical protein
MYLFPCRIIVENCPELRTLLIQLDTSTIPSIPLAKAFTTISRFWSWQEFTHLILLLKVSNNAEMSNPSVTIFGFRLSLFDRLRNMGG